MPAPNRDAMIRVRAEWKRDRICTRCGKGEAAGAYTRCAECLSGDAVYRAKRKNPLVRHSTAA